MKKKKRILIFLVPLVAGSLFLWGFLGDYSRALEPNWGLSLPWRALCREQYRQDTGPSFHGDGIRYHVFGYCGEESIREMVDWRWEEGMDLYGKTYSQAMEAWLDQLQVPEDMRPDYEKCGYWYQNKRDNSQMILIWDREEHRLYLGEFFL